MAIGNPTYKSVKAILKSALDKVAPPSEVEAPAIAHENIRGGDYFDRGEAASLGSDEIETHYLEEERAAIMNSFADGPIQEPSDHQEVRPDTPPRAVQHAANRAARTPVPSARGLPAILDRLKKVWTRPSAVEHEERHLSRRPSACIPSVHHDGHCNDPRENPEEVNQAKTLSPPPVPPTRVTWTQSSSLGERRDDDRRDD
jgi:hypothetical protein